MQNFTDKQWQTHGCFVYQMTAAVAVRSALNVGDDEYRTNLSFYKDDLVSVDLIRPSRVAGSTNGPFLRLSDNSGWLFEKKYGSVMAKRLPVEKGLWAFYVDIATSLMAHPHTSIPKFADSSTTYVPMQLLHFDRRVVSPSTKIASYRVQGTDGWLAEKVEEKNILVPDHKVKVGLFAYEVSEGSCDMPLSQTPVVNLETPQVSFGAGEILACDTIRHSPYGHGNGPFLRLNDGWGWVFEKADAIPNCRMREIPIEKGCWTFMVMNEPAGIAVRRHPLDRVDVRTSTILTPGQIVRCDRRVKSSGPTTFYRVTDLDGWVFDLRGDNVMMKFLSSRPVVESQPHGPGWSIEFIRGMASAFELEEVMFNEASRVISFKSDTNERINVYYTTRTVGTAINHPSQGQTQLFRRNCTDEELREIMQNPRVHTGKGYKKRSRVNGGYGSPYGHYNSHVDEDQYIDEEEEYRNKLLEYDMEEEKLAQKKMRALKALKAMDDERADDAASMQSKINARTEELKQMKREKEEAERQRIQAAENLRRRTCNVCHQVFVNEHAKNQHYQSVHIFECNHCYKDFNSRNALNQHKNACGHW